jgi:classical protein kinase C
VRRLLSQMLMGKAPFAHSPYFGGDTLTKIIRYADGDLLIEFADDLSPESQDLILKLLNPQPAERMDATQTKAHAFFEAIDFQALEQQRVPPPFLPKIASPMDTSNFHDFSDSDEDDDSEEGAWACVLQ